MDNRTKINSEAIKDELARLENDRRLTILFAVESGSRMWGFPSTDSDYDVRFIYTRAPLWYAYSPFLRKGDPDGMDTITHFTTNEVTKDVLDFHGWDVVKAVGLLQRSNPALHEWLASPIVYHKLRDWTAMLGQHAKDRWSAKAVFGHYMSMAHNNVRDYLRGDRVRYKKYLYVIRPILCAFHVLNHGTHPPMDFNELLAAATHMVPEVKEQVEDLIRRKLAGEELEDCPTNPILNSYIHWSMAELIARDSERSAAGQWVIPSLPDQNDDLVSLVMWGTSQYGTRIDRMPAITIRS